MKKIALLAAGLAIVFSAAFATTARAATDADLQAQIQSLLAMIANLQAQLAGGGSTSGTTTGSTVAMQFTMNHKQGDQGGEVMNIQKFLNMDPATMVASTGAGSPGNETSYFGPATKAAVIKFQNKYASEILAPVGLSAGTGYWGQSTRAKANAMEIARAAAASAGSGSGDSGTTTPTGSDLTVSAAAQPGNSLAPQSAANVPFTKFTLTAGASDMTVNSVTVELVGLADKGAFDSVVLLDENGNRIGLARSINSNNQATIGETMVIPAGSSKTFTVAANMLTSSLLNWAGQVAAFSVVSINTSETVSGSLPITGAQHTINSNLAIGQATYDEGANNPAAGKDFEIGVTNEIFASVEIDNTGSQEDIRVMSIRFYQKGSASASDLTNLVVEVAGTDYPVTVSSDGKYYTANFGSGIVLEEGKDDDFKLKGDVISGSGRTMEFDIDEDTDIVIVGETYGYGITPTDNFTSNSLDITGGNFQSFSRDNDIASANVSIENPDAILGGFKAEVEGESITVKTMSFDVSITHATGGSNTPAVADITNATLVDGNGATLAGPIDGTGTGLSGTLDFTNVTLPVGVTSLIVKGELSTNFENDDKIVLNTNPNSTDWDDVRGENTNDVIDTSGLSDVTAHTMTVKSASLTARNLAVPAAQNVVAGVTNFIWATAVLDAQDSGENIEVDAVTVTVVPTDEASASDLDSVAIWTLNADGTLNERVTDTENLSGAAGATVSTVFSMNENIIVPKGGNVEIAVVGNLASSVADSNSTADTWTVDISAVSAEGETSNVTADPSTIGGTNGQLMTLAGAGTLTPSIDTTSPVAGLITGGQEYTLGVYEFAADDVEDINLEKITITNTGTGTNVAAVSTYKVYDGTTLVGSTPGGASPVSVTLSGVTIPKDGKVDLTIKGVVAAIDGSTVSNEDLIIVDISALEATGATSGTSLDNSSVAVAAADPQKLVEVYPTVAIKDSGVSKDLLPSTQQLVAEIDFTAVGTQDLEFKQAGGTQLLISVLGDIAGNASVTLKDGDGNTLQSATAMTSNVLTATFAQRALNIAPGTTETIKVYADTSALTTAGNVVYVRLIEAAGGLRYYIDGTQLTTGVGDIVFKGNIDGPTFVKP